MPKLYFTILPTSLMCYFNLSENYFGPYIFYRITFILIVFFEQKLRWPLYFPQKLEKLLLFKSAMWQGKVKKFFSMPTLNFWTKNDLRLETLKFHFNIPVIFFI